MPLLLPEPAVGWLGWRCSHLSYPPILGHLAEPEHGDSFGDRARLVRGPGCVPNTWWDHFCPTFCDRIDHSRMPHTACTFLSEPRCLPCPWAPIFSSRKIRAQLAENLSPQWNWLTLGMSLPFSEPLPVICQKDVITCVHHSRGTL